MKRGDVVIAAEKGAFSGKPRPWLVLQNDAFLDDAATVTVCMISKGVYPSFARIAVAPSARNGLSEPSTIMADKVLTLRSQSVSQVIGELEVGALSRVDEAIRLWLDL